MLVTEVVVDDFMFRPVSFLLVVYLSVYGSCRFNACIGSGVLGIRNGGVEVDIQLILAPDSILLFMYKYIKRRELISGTKLF